MGRPDRPTFQTPTAVLAYAVALVHAMPPEHTVSEVRFGIFADGTGHYVSIEAAYMLGNTVQAQPRERDAEALARLMQARVDQVVIAWDTAREHRRERASGITDD